MPSLEGRLDCGCRRCYALYPPRSTRSKNMAIRSDTPCMFDVGQQVASEQIPDRLFGESGLHVGTSGFTAGGWQGTFYSTKFQTVEVDSHFYGPPSGATVKSWSHQTPPD